MQKYIFETDDCQHQWNFQTYNQLSLKAPSPIRSPKLSMSLFSALKIDKYLVIADTVSNLRSAYQINQSLVHINNHGISTSLVSNDNYSSQKL